jgi:hypothetical protein
MDVSVQHDNEGRQTFVGVLVPADGQGDPREVDLPTNHSAYREAYCLAASPPPLCACARWAPDVRRVGRGWGVRASGWPSSLARNRYTCSGT